MSTPEEIREDAKRDAWQERYEATRPDPCECGCAEWELSGVDPAYGADADGRRGVMLREWECPRCGALKEVIYG